MLVLGSASAQAAKRKRDTDPRVRTEQGLVRGKSSAEGRQFLGVPYAQPPVGDLRWRAPQPLGPRKKTLSAKRLRSVCLQDKTEVADRRMGSEDCLYLNISVPKDRENGQLPVMVWFHGGAFINGSGNIYQGQKLANTAKAIIVTVNYRLGPFGWLALPGLAQERKDGSTGNYGLMDQQAALRWVKSNIAGFGGDGGNVTIFGQSAGGEAGLAHLTSPASRGLFSKVISQSAPLALKFPTKDKAYAKYEPVAVRAGCPRSPQQVACLRNASGDTILTAAKESWDLIARLGLDWTPTNDGAILPRPFQEMVAGGDFAKVPVMIGSTRHEGKLFTAIFENNQRAPLTSPVLRERFTSFFSALSGLPPLIAAAPVALTELQYPTSQFPTPTLQGAGVITDALFTCALAKIRDGLSSKVPTYGYSFDDPNTPPVEIQPQFGDVNGAHDSELPYLFQIDPETGRPSALDAAQQNLGIEMGRYWGQFARTGDPNGQGLRTWTRWMSSTGTYQSLRPGGSVSGLRDSFRDQHKCGYWDRLLGSL